jgi:hypothetical protein
LRSVTIPFAEKLEDIVGLYLNSPEHALVLCVDEKSQIQESGSNTIGAQAGDDMSQMSRAEIIERIRPIILDSESSFTEWRATLDARDAELIVRAEVKRVSLIGTLLGRFLEPLSGGRAAEIGCGLGVPAVPALK